LTVVEECDDAHHLADRTQRYGDGRLDRRREQQRAVRERRRQSRLVVDANDDALPGRVGHERGSLECQTSAGLMCSGREAHGIDDDEILPLDQTESGSLGSQQDRRLIGDHAGDLRRSDGARQPRCEPLK
jgi:hypothetical protein